MKALKTNFKQADFIAMQNDSETRANRDVRLEGWMIAGLFSAIVWIPIIGKIFF